MVTVSIYCHKKREADILQELCGYCTALLGNEELLCISRTGDKKTDGRQRRVLWDMLFFELRDREDMAELRRLREKFPSALLMIIAKPDVSPERYLHPLLRPIMLLSRPFDRQKALEAVRTVFAHHYRQKEEELHMRRLMIRCGDERRYFRYEQILYLEAKEKKLTLYSAQEEVTFYGSLREMEEVLPEYFIRCHRSYIVNFMYLSRLNLSQNILHIGERYVIPISKRYKNSVNIQLESCMKNM